MTRTVLLAVGLGVAMGSACVQKRPFRCEHSEECVIGEARGLCQDEYCAYFDAQCPTELRYERNAGEGLGGQCVGMMDELSCELFCDVWSDVCADAVPIYDSFGDCLDACGVWPEDDLDEGDTLGCRYSAVLDAQRTEDFDDCFNATPSGGEACLTDENPPCFEFCSSYEERCGGIRDFFPDPDVPCDDVCLAYRPGSWGEESGDTLACRLNALGEEELEDEVACEIAGFESVDPCIE